MRYLDSAWRDESFSMPKPMFWMKKTFFLCNVKTRFLRGRTLVFLVPIDKESSYTYQNLLVDSALQALSNNMPINRWKSKKWWVCLGCALKKVVILRKWTFFFLWYSWECSYTSINKRPSSLRKYTSLLMGLFSKTKKNIYF